MKTVIGGDRLGSGQKMETTTRHFERSNQNLSAIWKSSMSSGTLVPFMSSVGLPGDEWMIELACRIKTLPTIGPLFGSYKVQLDIFEAPIRLYIGALYMDRLNIGREMQNAMLPKIRLRVNNNIEYVQSYEDNEHINSSCALKYLGISGLGNIEGNTNPAQRDFNCVDWLMYMDVYKNYYANKQEERGFMVHTGAEEAGTIQAIQTARIFEVFTEIGETLNNPVEVDTDNNLNMRITFQIGASEPDPNEISIIIDGTSYTATQLFNEISWDGNTTLFLAQYTGAAGTGNQTFETPDQQVLPIGGTGAQISLQEFPLANIDEMRELILRHDIDEGDFIIDENSLSPYNLPMQEVEGTGTDANTTYSMQYSQEGLLIKTYQSDLFNNWISTEWIDGTNGINEVTAVSTTGDSFTIDDFNIASKVYYLLNRIALSGGSYNDWIEAAFSQKRTRPINSPVYRGSLIRELSFEEIISTAETNEETEKPLGTLAGRGMLMDKRKGGRIRIKLEEPSYILGIVSITPRIEYSQGNAWDKNLNSMNDLHKPDLDAIGYQDLIIEQMLWTDSTLNSTTREVTRNSAGKQPSWINYMTEVNKCYGHFAEVNKSMFMVLNRRYEKEANGQVGDMTTYIDPSKFNHIFAQAELDAQNFWVQIGKKVMVRRKMSAKQIPNL